MYNPKHFAENDAQRLLAFMREFNFAALVTAENDFPVATHLPFIIERRNEKIILCAHLAKANLQWKQFAGREILVIFQEPYAYVSPVLYAEGLNAPTWNYVAVHAYGKARVFKKVEENLQLLEKMIGEFDRNYFENGWRKIPYEYKISRARAVVAFEIEVTDLQGKKKLNQNKNIEDARNVLETFDRSGNANERRIARFMKEIYDNKS